MAEIIRRKRYGKTTIAFQVSNNDYIVAGATYSDDGDVIENKSLSDIWIVQLAPFLNVDVMILPLRFHYILSQILVSFI